MKITREEVCSRDTLFKKRAVPSTSYNFLSSLPSVVTSSHRSLDRCDEKKVFFVCSFAKYTNLDKAETFFLAREMFYRKRKGFFF